MLDRQEDIRPIVYTVTEILKADKLDELMELLSNGQITIEQTGYDNWNGGIYFYTLL